MWRRSLLRCAWLAIVCAAPPASAGGPKVITLVQDGVLVDGTTTALPPVPMDRFRSVALLGNVGPGAVGNVSVNCAYTLEEASGLGMVPAVAGFSASVSNQVYGTSTAFPAPVLGPFMLCTLSCFGSAGIPPQLCTGTVTVKALLSK